MIPGIDQLLDLTLSTLKVFKDLIVKLLGDYANYGFLLLAGWLGYKYGSSNYILKNSWKEAFIGIIPLIVLIYLVLRGL